MMSDGLLRYMRDGFAGMLEWSMFAWLRPEVPVRLIRAPEVESVVLGCSLRQAPVGTRVRTAACALPDESVLVQEILLPDLGSTEIESVVEGEVRANSPFPIESVLSGWDAALLPDGRRKVWIAVADRSQVQARLKALGADHDAEAWVVVAGRVVPLVGIGGRVRRRAEVVGIVLRLALLGGLLAQSLALVVLPVWVDRGRAIEAIAGLDQITKSSAAVVGARDALTRINEGLIVLSGVAKEKIDVPWLIETLTRIVPDDAAVTRLEINGRHIKIAGTAANGTGLLDLLSAREEFKDVRATSPISRVGGAKRDSYVLEFDVSSQEGES